jgi:hypothetical protein
MKALGRLWMGSMLAVFALASGCAGHAAGDEDEDGSELGAEDSGKLVPTAQTDLLLFQGYDTVFDQGHGGAACVSYGANIPVTVGDVGVDVKVTWVSSREELAKQLGFDAESSFKVPAAGVDARSQVMNSFKRSSTTTNLLLRVGSYYSVQGGQTFKLTDSARQLLQTDPRGFLQMCGDAVVTSLQYRAEVIGLLRFDSNDQEASRKIAGQVALDAPALKSVADAKAKVDTTVETVKKSSSTNLSIDLVTQGFGPGGAINMEKVQGDEALGRLGDLFAKMAESVTKDRARAAEAVKAGRIPVANANGERGAIERSAKLGAITFHSYGNNESIPMDGVLAITQDTSKFLRDIGQVEARLENTYYEEVSAFLNADDQETYNLDAAPKPTASELIPMAQSWAQKLKPDGEGSITRELKDAQQECVRYALGGNFTKCKPTDAVTSAIAKGKKALEDYAAQARVVRMNILYGSEGEVVVDNALASCAKSGGRLPKVDELPWLAPAIGAKNGLAWISTPVNACKSGVAIFGRSATPDCYDGWHMDWWDSIRDRSAPVFCVAKNGPRVTLAPPGQ